MVERERIEEALQHWTPRMLVAGVDWGDLQRLRGTVASWSEWCRAWCALGAEHEALGDEAAREGDAPGAGAAWARAAVYYHFGQFMLFHDPELRRGAHEAKVRAYRKAAPLLDPPAERVSIPFEGAELPGYLRLPRAPAPHPAVIVLPGADSTKEELRTLEEELLRRGLATLTFDGPGQGETRYLMPLRPDYERAVAAACDLLCGRPEIRPDAIGVLGVSMGGYLAARAAAHEPRLKAAVSVAGPYDLSYWDRLSPLLQDDLAYLFGAATLEEARRFALEHITLEGVAERIACPYLIVHGELDRIIPADDARRLHARCRDVAELWIYPEGNHVCNNIAYKYRPRVAHWLRRRLLRWG